MKKVLEVVIYFTVVFAVYMLASYLTKYHEFTKDLFIDSVVVSSGITIGWYSYDYLHKKIMKKKEKCKDEK